MFLVKGLRAHLVLIATAPRKPAFSSGIVQTVATVAILFFANATDGKPPFGQTQIFYNYFFERNEKKSGFQSEINSENRPEKAFAGQIPRVKVENCAWHLFAFAFFRPLKKRSENKKPEIFSDFSAGIF